MCKWCHKPSIWCVTFNLHCCCLWQRSFNILLLVWWTDHPQHRAGVFMVQSWMLGFLCEPVSTGRSDLVCRCGCHPWMGRHGCSWGVNQQKRCERMLFDWIVLEDWTAFGWIAKWVAVQKFSLVLKLKSQISNLQHKSWRNFAQIVECLTETHSNAHSFVIRKL